MMRRQALQLGSAVAGFRRRWGATTGSLSTVSLQSAPSGESSSSSEGVALEDEHETVVAVLRRNN
jgi:hypothetical protein